MVAIREGDRNPGFIHIQATKNLELSGHKQLLKRLG
jgi:hypothetical protein